MKLLVLVLLPILCCWVAEEDAAAERTNGVSRTEAADLVPAAIAIRQIAGRASLSEGGEFERGDEEQMPILLKLAAPPAYITPRPARIKRRLHFSIDHGDSLR